MPVTIGELTTEVIAESDARESDTDSTAENNEKDAANVQAALAAMARRARRTCADDFDD